MATPGDPRRDLGRAIGKIPSGLFVLSTRRDQSWAAALVSWVQQAGFDPPMLTVALANDRDAAPLIRDAGAFALSIVGETDNWIIKKYARGTEVGTDPFAGVKILSTPAGLPVIADALAWLECAVRQYIDIPGSDHHLVVGEIVAGAVLKEGASFTHRRGSGLHY